VEDEEMKILAGLSLFVLMVAQLAAPTTALGEEVLSVRFPQGYRPACSTPVVARVAVSGPGLVTIKISVIPYKSLGFHPNIPISWRMDWWHYNKDFSSTHPLPGWQGSQAFQQGKKAGNFVDGVPLVVEDDYELEKAETYTGEVMGSPQCWATPDPDNPYWQEGQELRVEISGGGAVTVGDGEETAGREDAPLDVGASWQTTFGQVTLEQDGTTVRGTYDPGQQGRLAGTFEGKVLKGYWSEMESIRECATERLGTRYWGRIRWTFSDGAFTGTYGYCEEEPTSSWTGTRVGAAPENDTETTEAGGKGNGASDPETWPYRARWDQIAGPGMPWTTGWVSTPSPVCWAQGPEENPGASFRCACGEQNYCGSFTDGAVILHWQQGCDKPPVSLRCSTELKHVVDGLLPSVAGLWDTDFATVTFRQDGAVIHGTYTLDEGRLEGTLEGDVMSGYWGEANSDRACAAERLGTKYWGRFRFTFSADTFTGQWGHCEDEPTGAWNGKRLSS
jgi:hypothetical protein